MDNELLDIFTYRILADQSIMDEEISLLPLQRENAIAKLFRIFHNYKASATLLELPAIAQLAAQGENILNAMRTQKGDICSYDIQWLKAARSQLALWYDQLMLNEPISPIDVKVFPAIAFIEEAQKSIEIMKTLRLLYADPNPERCEKIQKPLEHIFHSVDIATTPNTLKSAVLNNDCDIVIVNMQEHSLEIAQELLHIKPDLGMITAILDLKPYQKSRLLLKGMTYPIASPIKADDLKRQLHNIVSSHFCKVYSIVSHETIYNFIQGLDPLPSSVRQISQLCDDPESSIKDLIHTIETDSVTTASVLHAASMPIYGIKNSQSLEQVVVSFGKRMIKAITLSDLACTLGSLQLDAYAINETQFKESSRKRLALMQKWYSRVDSSELDLLCSTAILGNLGEILINQEIINSGKEDDFKRYEEQELTKAEIDLLKTSTAFITADILEFWNLEPELVDAIRYSDNPFNAPTRTLQRLACANAIVYKMVTPHGELRNELSEEVRSLMLKASFEIADLEEAVHALEERIED